MEFADGRFEEAKSLLDESLKIRKGWTGQEIPKDKEQNYGLESIVLKLRARHHSKISGEESQIITKIMEHEKFDGLIADSINNMAATLVAQDQLEDAKKLFLESLNIRIVNNIILFYIYINLCF